LLAVAQAVNPVGIVVLIVLHRVNLGDEGHLVLAALALWHFGLLAPNGFAAKFASDSQIVAGWNGRLTFGHFLELDSVFSQNFRHTVFGLRGVR